MIELSGFDISTLSAVKNAIRWAEEQNRKIVSIGLPPRDQQEVLDALARETVNPASNLKLKELFGIPVKTSKTMQITVEFSRFKPLSR